MRIVRTLILFTALGFFYAVNLYADSSNTSSSSSSSSSFSSSSQGKQQTSHSESNSSMSWKTYNNGDITEFSMTNNIGSLNFSNKNEQCSFQDKPIIKFGNTFYFEDKASKCKITIKIKSGNVIASSNKKACVDAKYCTSNK